MGALIEQETKKVKSLQQVLEKSQHALLALEKEKDEQINRLEQENLGLKQDAQEKIEWKDIKIEELKH